MPAISIHESIILPILCTISQLESAKILCLFKLLRLADWSSKGSFKIIRFRHFVFYSRPNKTWAVMDVLGSFNPVFERQDLSQFPAAQPPDGLSSNFVDPPSLGLVYLTIIYLFMPLMFIFVVVRLYARIMMVHKLGVDDCT